MALLLALVCACSLASGHRIQPLSQRKQALKAGQASAAAEAASAPPAAAAVAAESTAQSSEIQQQAASQPLKNASSMIEEKAHVSKHADDTPVSEEPSSAAGSIFDKMKTFMYYNAKDTLTLAEHYFNSASRPVMGMFLGSGFVMLSCVAFCFVQLLTSILPRKRKRFQHIHDGRVVYEWDQTPKVATLYIRPPDGMTKNDLDIRIACRNVRVGRKGKPSFIREETYDVVNEDMSSWSLRSNGELQIYLQKVRRAEWPTVLLHNEKFPIPSLNSKLKLPVSWTKNQEKSSKFPVS